jgi:S-adenosylmethionine:tRNA ribosyltransferase-isomerase
LSRLHVLNNSQFEIEDYDYELPEERIAQVPSSRRDASRLLVVDRAGKNFSDHLFSDLSTLLCPGDLLVVNDTRVVPAKLFGRKESGGRVEILVLEHPESGEEGPAGRRCLLKSSKRPKAGTRLFFEQGVSGSVTEVLDGGLVKIAFSGDRPIDALLAETGNMPLPPYIRRGHDRAHTELDRERYQTIFSRTRGAVAAPTAGLHFTEDLIRRLEETSIATASLTLHVGYGTFRPVRSKDIRGHHLDAEFYRISAGTAAAVEKTKEAGGRVVAVGTTTVRALETAVGPDGSIVPGEGMTELLVTPGFSFRVVDALITNFHLPRSSLLFLVSAFAGLERVKAAYSRAIEKGYRFYSYGDAMLIR